MFYVLGGNRTRNLDLSELTHAPARSAGVELSSYWLIGLVIYK